MTSLFDLTGKIAVVTGASTGLGRRMTLGLASAGADGGLLLATSAGFLLEWTGSYMTLFIISGSVYLAALGVIHMLVPRLEPADISAS